MGIFRYEGVGSAVTGPCSLHERGRIDAEAFFHGEGVRRGEA
jgi:hypothetical protein